MYLILATIGPYHRPAPSARTTGPHHRPAPPAKPPTGVIDMKIIIKKWRISGKQYYLLLNEGEQYLYYTDDRGSLKGLMKGRNFEQRIEELVQHPEICIECSICDLITAGISVDNGDIVEFGLSAQDANRILEEEIFEVKKTHENN